MESNRADRILATLALTLLGVGCVYVLWPFMTSLVWAAILASTCWVPLLWLDRLLGGRRVWAASLMTLTITVVVLGPVLALALGLADNLAELGKAVSDAMSRGLPDAPEWVRRIPLLGHWLHDYWQRLAHDGQRLMAELNKFAKPAQDMALSAGTVVGRGVIDLTLSVFLAFFLFLHGEVLASRLKVALARLAGARAGYLLEITIGTIHGVIYGVLGTALAQGVLAAIGFLIAGVPGALLLGMVTFFFSVVPVGPPMIWGGAAIWLFQQGQIGWAIFMAAWGFFLVSTVDNVIKPFIISRGSNLPFAVVFLGVLGGVLSFGVIGAFLGPTLLALGYRLVGEWTGVTVEPEQG
ncbi:AI-2E family transporter [Aquabacterium sp.]|uniref:AI-2E family transporter n=1 Tax=Aquabacterium sp. TaxID=1872578 RepID=UPI002E2F9DAE|nr:AI-2E family transporter [Aquabacterium sp.]HEX5312879.1 AI-2E family transporter [Aquabacterium sp.]